MDSSDRDEYAVRFHPKAVKELRGLDKVTRERVGALVVKIRKDPRARGEAMKGCDRQWKYRVGHYRVIAIIEDSLVLVTIVRLGSRGQIYRDNG